MSKMAATCTSANAIGRDDDYAMLLLLALKDTFPCSSPTAAPEAWP